MSFPRTSLIVLVALMAAGLRAAPILDPDMSLDTDLAGSDPVPSLTFSFTSNAQGGGIIERVNTSGFDWNRIDIRTHIELPGDLIPEEILELYRCQSNTFSCSVTLVGDILTISYFDGVLPSVPPFIDPEQTRVGHFRINLNTPIGSDSGTGGWGPNRSFEGTATPVPEPAIWLLLAAAAPVVLRRWRKRSAAVIVVLVSAATATTAATITGGAAGLPGETSTITFDEFGNLQGQVITNQFAALGATFSGFGWDSATTLGQAGSTGFAGGALVNSVTGFPSGPMTITFGDPVSGAAFAAVGQRRTFQISAYLGGAGGTLVQAFSAEIPFNPGIGFLGFHSILFDTITIAPQGSSGTNLALSIDTLQARAAVPEPGPAMLIGASAWILLGVRRIVARRA